MSKYKLLKDLPGYPAGTVFDTDDNKELNDIYKGGLRIGSSWSNYTNHPDWFQPLPQPKEEKTEYRLALDYVGSDDFTLLERITLTDPAAQAVAEAIRTLLKYVNTPYDRPKLPGDLVGYPGYTAVMDMHKAIEAARTAVQGDKDE